MLRVLLCPLIVAATGCLALDPNYWNCDESPYLARNIGLYPDDEPACADSSADCEYRVGREESLRLSGRTCDYFFTHSIAEVRLDPPLAEWRIESILDDGSVIVFVPTESGTATLSLVYDDRGSLKEFHREIRIVADDPVEN